MKWLPLSVFANAGVCENEELSHDGGEGDFSQFAFFDEAIMEGSERRVETSGGQRSHIESASDMGASALDVTGSAALAAIAGDRGEADEHGGFFGRQGADLGEAGDQGDRGCDSYAGDGGQKAIRLVRKGSAAIRRSISAPRFSIAVSAARSCRLISATAGQTVVAPSWLSKAVRASEAASWQRTRS